MDVVLPDGTIVNGVPDGTTKAQLAEKLKANGRSVPEAWLAGDASAAFARGEAHTMIPGAQPQPKPQKEPGIVDDTIAGGMETAGSMATAIPAGVAGNIAGLLHTMTGGKFGTAEGTREGAQRAGEVSESLTYAPRGPAGQRTLKRVGDLVQESGVAGLNPSVPIRALPPAAGGTKVRDIIGRGADRVGDLLEETADMPAGGKQPAMAGVGSAETDVARQRRERAGGLPVPVTLTKGQAERDFEQQRFERETAKDPKAGKPLRERFAEQNEQILQNFDSWIDQTGAEAPDLRATGKVVDQALVEKANRAKKEVDKAYNAARESGETSRMVPTDELVAWIEKSRSAAKNAPVISAIEDELVRLQGATRGADGKLKAGNMTINDLEEVRKMVGRLADPGTPNLPYGIDAKKLIDAATEGRGGKLYQQARKLRSDYAREFEDHGVVAKLLRAKPGTADRAVAYEDVFAHSILTGSLDDVRTLARTLKGAGPQGERAWRELQGATIGHIRDEITKNVATDERGNRIVSASKLDKLIADLDRDGKLDYIFGKRNAEQLRDINDLAKDVYTAPPGAVNSSGTASVMLQALGEIATGHLSIGTAKALAVAKKAFEGRKTRKRVREALADDPISTLTDDERDMRVRDLVQP